MGELAKLFGGSAKTPLAEVFSAKKAKTATAKAGKAEKKSGKAEKAKAEKSGGASQKKLDKRSKKAVSASEAASASGSAADGAAAASGGASSADAGKGAKAAGKAPAKAKATEAVQKVDTAAGKGKGKGASAKAAKAKGKDRELRTIFVGNVSIDASKKDVKQHFAEHGEIEAVRFRSMQFADDESKKPKRAKALLGKAVTGTSCNAYVVFHKATSARAALKKDGSTLKGLHLRVDMAASGGVLDPKRTVFVGNVPRDVTDEAMRVHFSKVGTVAGIRVLRDRQTRVGQGVAYVLMSERGEVKKALSLDGSLMSNRKIRVELTRADGGKGKGKSKHPAREGRPAGQKRPAPGSAAAAGGAAADAPKKAKKPRMTATEKALAEQQRKKKAAAANGDAAKAAPSWQGTTATKGDVPTIKQKKKEGVNENLKTGTRSAATIARKKEKRSKKLAENKLVKSKA